MAENYVELLEDAVAIPNILSAWDMSHRDALVQLSIAVSLKRIADLLEGSTTGPMQGYFRHATAIRISDISSD